MGPFVRTAAQPAGRTFSVADVGTVQAVVQTIKTLISNGGKTRANIVSGIDAKGQKVNIVAVFEKQ
jgi:hypothetical protein